VSIFSGFFPIRKACVPNFYNEYINGTKYKMAADTCDYGAGYTCEWFASLSLFFSALGYFKLAAAYREADPALATYTAVDEVTYTPLPGAEAMNNDASNVMVYSNPNPTPVVVAGAAAEEEEAGEEDITFEAVGADNGAIVEGSGEAHGANDVVVKAAAAGVYRVEGNLAQPILAQPAAVTAHRYAHAAPAPRGKCQTCFGKGSRDMSCWYIPMVLSCFVVLGITISWSFNANPYGSDGLCNILPETCPVGTEY